MCDRDVSNVKDVFLDFDESGNGKIKVDNVSSVIRSLGENPSQADMKIILDSHNIKEQVTFEQFLPMLEQVRSNRCNNTTDDFIEWFSHISVGNVDGFISYSELVHLLTNMGEKLTENEVNTVLDGLINEDGNINTEALVKKIMRE